MKLVNTEASSWFNVSFVNCFIKKNWIKTRVIASCANNKKKKMKYYAAIVG